MGKIFKQVEGILCEFRDDMTSEKLQKTVADIGDYFAEHLPQYKVVKIRRKSFHIEDAHLFMIAAVKKDGTSWAVWTGWNGSTNSLNHGHYDLPDLGTCDRIMDDFYNDGH